MDKYISINLVSQSLILQDILIKNKCSTIHECKQLNLPYGINLQSAMSFAIQCKWILINEGCIRFSDIGKTINELFDGSSIGRTLWKVILSEYIAVCRPAWARRIPYGRQEAFIFMNGEEQLCFREADLMESTDADVIAWWDGIAEKERIRVDESKNEIGRQGETLTIKYEELRTGAKPVWYSIDSNVAGYDIMSQRSMHNKEQILIEVKTSTKPIHEGYCIITRNEWEMATRKNNLLRYYFYLWSIAPRSQSLAIIDVGEMRRFIPTDSGHGKWESAKVTFNAFSTQFSSFEGTCFL